MNTLQSSALPLDSGGYVVTVVAPSAPTFKALLRAINAVNPDAYEPVGPMDHSKAAALVRDLVVEGDEPIGPRCATGSCGVD